ncbi:MULTISPECIES: hypothetical protein [unclassified Anabaena]|uniref:hypothetical protein n=1 Tax=unclassified Anabaena TaxID=2619674 RepID=UPI0039C5EB10
MTQSTPKQPARRGRIFPERTLSLEELTKRKAEEDDFDQRCQAIFEQVRPDFIQEHYGWYIAVEPNSGDYFIDQDKEAASQKARQQHPNAIHFMFCLNETGTTGKI